MSREMNRRAILAGVAAIAPVAALTAAPALAAPDAELIALGERLRAAWSADKATIDRLRGIDTHAAYAEIDASIAACSAIVADIESMRATTLEGVKVKALAVSWCHSGEPFDDESFSEQATTDVRIVSSILNDLLSTWPAA